MQQKKKVSLVSNYTNLYKKTFCTNAFKCEENVSSTSIKHFSLLISISIQWYNNIFWKNLKKTKQIKQTSCGHQKRHLLKKQKNTC